MFGATIGSLPGLGDAWLARERRNSHGRPVIMETFAARTKRRQIHAHRDRQPKREVPKSLITMRTEQDRTSRIVERSRQTTAWIRFCAFNFRQFPG